MKQYLSVKREHQDAILLFRMGDFYEMFHDDAKLASRVLGLTLTSREKGENAVPMAGFPHHASESYVRRLIQAGHRVAICEQVEDPADAKGIVARDVIRIITPGTITEDGLLEEKRNNFLLGLLIGGGNRVGLAWVDLSTGRFQLVEVSREQMPGVLARIMPAEIICPDGADDSAGFNAQALRDATGAAVSLRPAWEFGAEAARRSLLEHFKVATLEGFGCEDAGPSIGAAGAVLAYLQDTQKTALAHINKLERCRSDGVVALDRATQSSLELLETMRGGDRLGSLLGALDETLTPMGGRLMREWILSPLRSLDDILSRQDCVAELRGKSEICSRLRKILGDVHDIERLAAKVSIGRCNARDFVGLSRSARQLPALKSELAKAGTSGLAALRGRIDTLEDIRAKIDAAILPDPALTLRDGGMIRDGYNAELDELRHISRHGRSWIVDFEQKEIARAGIPSLKVGFNKVFGYYIEITNVHAEKVPADYVRKQTLKNAERYITPELKDYENKVISADERSKQLEYELFQQIRDEVAAEVARMQETASAVAETDVLCSLAQTALLRGYCRPELDNSSNLVIRDGRHPVLEQIMTDERFVPNDVAIDGDGAKLLIITGPNMAGKSVYIRQIALIVLMAQMGSFVPAKYAKIGLVDRIFTRVGAGEEQSRGQSTFMVEMLETANILNNATDRSLIVLDEVGRGTSTFDGVSIAWAVAEYIHDAIGARTLFATHYHEMAQLVEVMPGVANYNVLVREWQDEIVFIRKVAPGSTDRSYGIHVARLAGLPKEVISRAGEILATLESHSLDMTQSGEMAKPREKSAPSPKLVQMPLFSLPDTRVREVLKALDPAKLSPEDALAKLRELKDIISGEETERGRGKSRR